MPIKDNLDLVPDKMVRKESSEIDYASTGGSVCGGGRELAGTNSNGTLNMSNENHNGHGGMGEPEPVVNNPCLRSFKACCKKKADFGLEDTFWISLLIILIIFAILKTTTRMNWTNWGYFLLGSVIVLILLYCIAATFNKFVLDDSTTAHWNAHARFTQAAIQERLREEEHRVHVIAPPKMGGAKLNIIYTVGDVPLVRDSSGRSAGGTRHPSSGSLGLSGGGAGSSTSGTPTTAVALATSALIAPTALTAALASPAKTPPHGPPSNAQVTTAIVTQPSKSAVTQLEAIIDLSESSASSSSSTSSSKQPQQLAQSTNKTVPSTIMPETIDEESENDRIESPCDKVIIDEQKRLLQNDTEPKT